MKPTTTPTTPLISMPTGVPPPTSASSSTPLDAASAQANEEEDVATYQKAIDGWNVVSDACKAIQKVMQSEQGASEADLDEEIQTFMDKLGRKYSHFIKHFERLQHLDPGNSEQRQECMAAIHRFFVDPAFDHNADRQVLPAILRSLPLAPKVPRAKDDPEEDDLRELLAENIRRNYRGNAPFRLLNFAMKVNRIFFHQKAEEQRPYIKGTPIVQSSGTGKTRLVLELGRIAPLLFLCIRPLHTNTARNGYPLGDKPVVDFVFQDCAKSSIGYNEQAAILLAAWFDTLAFELRLLPTPEDKKRLLTRLNDYGGDDHARERDAFFNSVLIKARKLLKRAPTVGDYAAIFNRYLNQPVFALSQQLKEVRECMARNYPKIRSAPIFVAIDECVALPAELLVSIRRAWNHINHLETATEGPGTLCFWLILMSTSSGASSLVRPQHEHPSDRDKATVALPTFVGVGFDVLRTEQPPLVKAIDVSQAHYISFYGRPLWQSLLSKNFWSTAIRKLLGTQKFQRGIRVMCFNVLASRLALRYVPVRGADSSLFGEQLSFAHEGVDRHMRILAKVETDSSLHIRSPSEPVLAIAASLVLMPTPASARNDSHVGGQIAENRYGSILETLKDNCLASANIDILKGTRGELMARLLLMTAWDATKVAGADWFTVTESYKDKAAHLLKPVPLAAILHGLVELDQASARRVHQRIEQVCSLVAQTQLAAAAAGANIQAWTHYTHFDILETRIEEISTEYLWYCWKRGVVIQMAHPQHGIDGIIPVFVGDIDQPFVDDGHQVATDPQAESGLATTKLGPGRQAQTGASASAEAGTGSARRDFRGEIKAARQMTYVAWEAKNRKESGPKLVDEAAKKPKHAGPILKHATGEASELSKCGMLTILADMGVTVSQSPRVESINGTDSLQLWIRGLDGAANYPCLATLGIRNVALSFLRAVSEHMDYDNDNMILDPMALSLAKLRLKEEKDKEEDKDKDSSDDLNVIIDNVQADESLSSPIPAPIVDTIMEDPTA
ncbi:hypothetical protein NDA16_003988 [Ustilago loliicola]|nr:hypothetical protein NDA16_003988 [Ustilago loliicola]